MTLCLISEAGSALHEVVGFARQRFPPSHDFDTRRAASLPCRCAARAEESQIPLSAACGGNVGRRRSWYGTAPNHKIGSELSHGRSRSTAESPLLFSALAFNDFANRHYWQ